MEQGDPAAPDRTHRRRTAPPDRQGAPGAGPAGNSPGSGEQIFIDYQALGQGSGYVRPSVLLEFGARSTGEPNEPKPVVCDAAAHLQDLGFPTATPQVMRAERTFWEKATAIHVFCAQGSFRGGARFARHWHDVTRLHEAGFADSAAADRELAKSVAAHKSIFFSELALDGTTARDSLESA